MPNPEKFEFKNEKKASLTKILEARASEAFEGMGEMPLAEKEKIFDSAKRLSSEIPEIIITGGTALRIYLEAQHKKVPKEFGRDIDCVLDKEIYEKLREALPPKNEKESTLPCPDSPLDSIKKNILQVFYRRKGSQEKTSFGEGNFLHNPEKQMALEDKKNFYHIDIFPFEEQPIEIRKINLEGQNVNLIAPEELFLRKISQIHRGIENKSLQRRHIIYFYILGSLINEAKMDKLWERIRKEKKDIADWRQIWQELDRKIKSPQHQKEITEEIAH